MTYPVATTSERVRTAKSDHCACARMHDMRLDESWTGRIWEHHSGNTQLDPSCVSAPLATNVDLFVCFAERLFKSS